MTLRLSPKQLDILSFLKANPNNTPEMYAKAHFQAVKTIYTQLGRVRAKDKAARVFRARLNGMIGNAPWMRQYLKVPNGTEPLSEAEKAQVDRGLQEPERRGSHGNRPQKSVRKRPNRGKRKKQGSKPKKKPNRGHRKV